MGVTRKRFKQLVRKHGTLGIAYGLIGFLNLDVDKNGVASEDFSFLWQDYLKTPQARKEAKRTQREVLRDLLPIVDGVTLLAVEERIRLVNRLVRKINDLKFISSWFATPLVKRNLEDDSLLAITGEELKEDLQDNPGEPVILLGMGWVLQRQLARAANGPFTLRAMVYWIVAKMLEGGVLDEIRRCAQCSKFMIADNQRKLFCSTECKDAYNNQRRLSEGYFIKLRRDTRKNKLALARKLRKEGQSLEDISETTKLSERILERAGII
jgi:hypothetical protein